MSKGKFYAGDFRLGYCAFCKHWYDPTNSAIKPLPGNWWEFDREKEARCMKSVGLKTKGRHTCNKFGTEDIEARGSWPMFWIV